MASAEQPLKKRKLYEQFQHSSPSTPAPPPPPPPPTPPPPPLPLQWQSTEPPPPGTPPVQPLSQEQILRRQRNREEIREVYNCLKQIKSCIAKKEPCRSHSPELEQAYRYLIAASRGCASVQRIVADLIPRYASYCPTALEAAIKVVFNMHNCSLPVISKGEDFDGVAYGTVEACIFGLITICQAATKEAPTSSIIRGICSAVFRDVFTFLISSFEGKDVFQIVNQETLKILEDDEYISCFKEKFVCKGDSTVLKISKFRAATFLRLLFCCPMYSLSVCFEFLNLAVTDFTQKEGHYFLRQLTSTLDDAATHGIGRKSSPNSAGTSCQSNVVGEQGNVAESDHTLKALGNCILGLILEKDPSLKSWFLSKYRKLSKSAVMETVPDVTSVLDSLLGSFPEELDRYGGECGQSKYSSQSFVHSESSFPETSSEDIGKGSSLRIYDKFANKFSSLHVRKQSSIDYHSSLSIDTGGSTPMDFDFGGGDSSQCRSSTPRDFSNRNVLSPKPRTPVGSRGSSQGFQREKTHLSNRDISSPTPRFTSEGMNRSFNSPKHHASVGNLSINPLSPFSDGDPEAMDVFAASKQLWVGSLGPEATDGLVRSQFEKFGPINHFTYSPRKGYALIEYRNMMDAIKARANMRGRSAWGACVSVKFSDMNQGVRGGKDGVSVATNCHVYVGYVSNHWQRDEIMNEVSKALNKGPRMATHLNSEGALLMEFDTPDEANGAVVHLRKFRRESVNLVRSNGPSEVAVHAATAGPGSTPILVDKGSKHSASQVLPENPSDDYSVKISHLSSIVSQLRMKYNIAQNPVPSDSRVAGNHQIASTRDELPATSTLWISIPHMNTIYLTDDELWTLCNVAINNVGSIVRLTKNVPTGNCWFVECNSVGTAKALMKHFRDCPGMFFQIEFSHNGKHPTARHPVNPDGNTLELASPRLNPENQGIQRQGGHVFQSNWSHAGHRGMPEIGARTSEALFADPSHGGSADRMWMFRNSEMEMHSGQGNLSRVPAQNLGPPIVPPVPVQSPQFRPLNFPPTSSWDPRSHMPMNPISPGIMPNIHQNQIPPTFMPVSVTPLPQYHGNSMPPYGHMYPGPMGTPPAMIPPLPPSQSGVQPPLPPSQPPPPPPPPYSQPPLVPPPPPPSSPPPPPPPPVPSESFDSEHAGQSSVRYRWQGTLNKSGVQFCTIIAQRAESDSCRYSDDMAEPTEWPAKLDMTKRTDFRHVRTTFANTPPHKKDVCWLFPLSEDDHKGFQDFVSYLQQRECAGVIRIPAANSMWARLLFIMPYSLDMCSLLSIAPNPSPCLIGLVLPKETNFEWA
ncbi:OLC1v1016973C5 [Oldenlandia corymbosa var. corymbosa]|uniref:OLC1v1016973C5 n=2 Tax=Oldenlandia corymbosa var. corymbosa TaxID=529605 RepID=A0AAV1E8F0_OLDCO|nr:OLC1v1016973C5 [Oldenlandia corymbosa var. corymbosa]